MHYDLSGTPDRYAGTTLIRWMALPLLCAALAAVMYAVAWLCTRMPINVLPQAEYDALPPQDKMRIISHIQRYLYWVTAGITVWFMVMQYGKYRIAIGAAESRPLEPGLTIAATLLLIGSSFWITRKIKHEVRARHK